MKDANKTTCCNGSNVSGGQNLRGEDTGPQAWFGQMIQNCYEYASQAKAKRQGVVGIMCEYTPRELIMAAGAVPVCLCGGSVETIPAAERDLPTNLCPLIKSTYGYSIEKSNPFLEMADLVVAETTCDGKKKMYELLLENHEVYVLELPQKAVDGDAMRHWTKELRKFKSKLEDHFKVKITDEKIRSAIKIMNRERQLRRRLAEVMKQDRPPLNGRQLLDFKSSISGIEADLAQYEKATDIFATNHSECQNSGPIRVLMTGVPMVHGAERVLEIIEKCGAVVVCMENCTGLRPIIEDVDEKSDDAIEALAEKYFHLPCSVMTPNTKRLELLHQLAKEYRADCIIELIWQACLTYDVESYFVKELAEKKLGIGYLKIETDYWPADSERISMRVEALFETVRQRKKEKLE